MIYLRSALFNVAFYLNLLIQMIVLAPPAMLLPSRFMVRVARTWAATNLWLLRVICGTKVEWRGRDKIPPGACLVASKHQSAWETFALFVLFPDPTIVLKRELMWLAPFGWYMWKAGMIPVDRGAGKQALAKLIARTRAALAKGRQVIVFPEGTRRPPGAEPDYKPGIAQLYAANSVPCLPIALNSGLYWPRRRLVRYPGTIRVEILDPIPAGLARNAFYRRLQEDIETATRRLIAEGERERAAHDPAKWNPVRRKDHASV